MSEDRERSARSSPVHKDQISVQPQPFIAIGELLRVHCFTRTVSIDKKTVVLSIARHVDDAGQPLSIDPRRDLFILPLDAAAASCS